MSKITVYRRLGVGLPAIEAHVKRPLRAGDTLVVLNERYKRITLWTTDPRGVIEQYPRLAFNKTSRRFRISPTDIAIKVCRDGSVLFGSENIPEFVVVPANR